MSVYRGNFIQMTKIFVCDFYLSTILIHLKCSKLEIKLFMYLKGRKETLINEYFKIS